MSSRETILEILHTLRPECDFNSSKDFITDGLLDSFDIVTLVNALEKAFGITIDGKDILPENFQNLEAIQALVNSCKSSTS